MQFSLRASGELNQFRNLEHHACTDDVGVFDYVLVGPVNTLVERAVAIESVSDSNQGVVILDSVFGKSGPDPSGNEGGVGAKRRGVSQADDRDSRTGRTRRRSLRAYVQGQVIEVAQAPISIDVGGDRSRGGGTAMRIIRDPEVRADVVTVVVELQGAATVVPRLRRLCRRRQALASWPIPCIILSEQLA